MMLCFPGTYTQAERVAEGMGRRVARFTRCPFHAAI